jgi:hypothetical protein
LALPLDDLNYADDICLFNHRKYHQCANKVGLKLNVQECVEYAGELAAAIDNVSDSGFRYLLFETTGTVVRKLLDSIDPNNGLIYSPLQQLQHKLGNISRLFEHGKESSC